MEFYRKRQRMLEFRLIECMIADFQNQEIWNHAAKCLRYCCLAASIPNLFIVLIDCDGKISYLIHSQQDLIYIFVCGAN